MSIFFFNDTATTEIYTLSLHDALPICGGGVMAVGMTTRLDRVLGARTAKAMAESLGLHTVRDLLRHYPHRYADRKSTRLNSSHANISYAVFCLNKKIYHHSTLPSRLLL